jgi:NADH-quinone oxidoreductase subunit J
VIQGSVFIALLQILTYVGAIIVLVLFTIMLMDLRKDQEGPPLRAFPLRFMAFSLALISLILLGRFFMNHPFVLPEFPEGELSAIGGVWGGIRHVGAYLYDAGGLFPFEFITILLLSTLVGCVDLCRKKEMP